MARSVRVRTSLAPRRSGQSLDRTKRKNPMSFFSWFKKKAFGEELADFGELPSKAHGWRVSVSLRQIRDQPPYWLLKWEEDDSHRIWTSLACTPEVYEKLETIVRETRKTIGH